MTKTELKNLKEVRKILDDLEGASYIELTDEFEVKHIISCNDCKRGYCPQDCILKSLVPATLEQAAKLCDHRLAKFCQSQTRQACQSICCYECSLVNHCYSKCDKPEDILDERRR